MSENKDYQKIFGKQINKGVGLTSEMTGKSPAIAKRIFDKKEHVEAFINNPKDTAIEGLILTVIADENNNGVYFVKSIGKKEEDNTVTPGELIKLGSIDDIYNLQNIITNLDEELSKNAEVIAQSLNDLRNDLTSIQNELNQSISDGTEITSATTQLVEGKAVYEYVTSEVGKLEEFLSGSGLTETIDTLKDVIDWIDTGSGQTVADIITNIDSIENRLTAATLHSYGLVKLGTNTLTGNIHPVGVNYDDQLYFGISNEFENYSGSLKLKDHHNIAWDGNSDMNNLKTAGVYDIYGQRLSLNDNMPITNSNPGHSISAKLFVIDSSLKPDDGSVPTEICVTQFLQLSNRLGGDGASYTRTYNEYNGNGKWSPWQKQQGIVETLLNTDGVTVSQKIFSGLAESIGGGLNSMIDNGIYSGMYTDAVVYSGEQKDNNEPLYVFDKESLTFLETFVLIVINDYVAASTAGSVRTITQLKYSTDTVNPDNSKVKKRVGIGNDEITWGEWDSIAMQSELTNLDTRVELYNELTQTELETLNNSVSANTKSISELQNEVSENAEVTAKVLLNFNEKIEENSYEKVSYEEVTYSDIVSLRDNNQLVPGKKYRITDYNYELSNKSLHAWDVEGAGHQFDIIVEALTKSTLSENAKACLHEGDVYFTKCDLNAWELKYCIDNDKARFEWADTSEKGKGVIYYMKDEFNNECSYDFKNVKILRHTNGTYHPRDEQHYYTFSVKTEDGTYKDLSVYQYNLNNKICFNNKIKPFFDKVIQRINGIIITVPANSWGCACLEFEERCAAIRINCNDGDGIIACKFGKGTKWIDFNGGSNIIFEGGCENIAFNKADDTVFEHFCTHIYFYYNEVYCDGAYEKKYLQSLSGCRICRNNNASLESPLEVVSDNQINNLQIASGVKSGEVKLSQTYDKCVTKVERNSKGNLLIYNDIQDIIVKEIDLTKVENISLNLGSFLSAYNYNKLLCFGSALNDFMLFDSGQTIDYKSMITHIEKCSKNYGKYKIHIIDDSSKMNYDIHLTYDKGESKLYNLHGFTTYTISTDVIRKIHVSDLCNNENWYKTFGGKVYYSPSMGSAWNEL